ncbi:MAG: hypothetical protein PHX38_01790 [Sulfuricella sp.]|nr:hypothetical protein [Sulfuricella sp.]
MKKFALITIVSFVVVGILSFFGLNAITWITKEIEKGQRPDHSQNQPAPQK